MSRINSGNIAISTEDKQINSKPSESNDNNPINNPINSEKNNNNYPEDIEDLPPYYRLFIYSDTGLCIYKAKTKDYKKQNSDEDFDDNDGVDKDLGAIQGIIQAIFFTPLDLQCELHMISTDVVLLMKIIHYY